MPRSADQSDQRYHKRREQKERLQSQLPGADDEPLPPPAETIRAETKPKRNAPCPCGSGKKYKQCCGKK